MTNTYKIVKILDEYSVIINAGTNMGIEIGDEFQILDTEGSEVIDPETGAVLGYLELVKETVRVSDVHEKMCFCETGYSVGINQNIIRGLSNIANAYTYTERKKLNVDLTQVTGGLRHSDAPIRVGDIVKRVSSKKQTIE